MSDREFALFSLLNNVQLISHFLFGFRENRGKKGLKINEFTELSSLSPSMIEVIHFAFISVFVHLGFEHIEDGKINYSDFGSLLSFSALVLGESENVISCMVVVFVCHLKGIQTEREGRG